MRPSPTNGDAGRPVVRAAGFRHTTPPSPRRHKAPFSLRWSNSTPRPRKRARGPFPAETGQIQARLAKQRRMPHVTDRRRRQPPPTTERPVLLPTHQFHPNGALWRRFRVGKAQLPQGYRNAPGGRFRPKLVHVGNFPQRNDQQRRRPTTKRPVPFPAPDAPIFRRRVIRTADHATAGTVPASFSRIAARQCGECLSRRYQRGTSGEKPIRNLRLDAVHRQRLH